MEFITNNINLGKAKTLEQLIEEKISKKTEGNDNIIKTASVKEVKIAEKEESKEGLTAAQKKLPEALQDAILSKKDSKKEEPKDSEKKDEDKEEKKEESKDSEKKDEAKDEKKEAKVTTSEFKKIANLSKEDKGKVREFFNRYFPSQYTEAVIADK